MGVEIERKYKVRDVSVLANVPGVAITQGYIYAEGGIVRVRIQGAQGFVTFKGRGLLERAEFEYPVPLADARQLLAIFCVEHVLEKTRHEIACADHVFTVDVFHGRHAGLILAEVELNSPDEHISLPAWIGEEVTYDARYHNSNLVKNGAPAAV